MTDLPRTITVVGRKTNSGTSCSHCGTTYAKCTDGIFNPQRRKSCCSYCYTDDTHDTHDVRDAALAVGDTVSTVEELSWLPVRSILRDRDGLPVWRSTYKGWEAMGGVHDIDEKTLIADGAPFLLVYLGAH